MKQVLIVLVCIAFVMICSAGAKGQESEAKPKPKPCEYTGTIDKKLDRPDRLEVNMQGSIKEFYFKEDERKGCVEWTDLKIGENVHIACKQTHDVLEATCVTKSPPGAPLSGVTMHGGQIRY